MDQHIQPFATDLAEKRNGSGYIAKWRSPQIQSWLGGRGRWSRILKAYSRPGQAPIGRKRTSRRRVAGRRILAGGQLVLKTRSRVNKVGRKII
ncbi:MAG: hypothetical protein CMN76_05780 [Spirochaetaceae bacterium]|nr:hypothetical protein [Spirochaetaceae bacterium]